MTPLKLQVTVTLVGLSREDTTRLNFPSKKILGFKVDLRKMRSD